MSKGFLLRYFPKQSQPLSNGGECHFVILQIGLTVGLLVFTVNLHRCKPWKQEGKYLSVGRNGPVKSHHPFICLKDKIEEWKMKKERKRKREKKILCGTEERI